MQPGCCTDGTRLAFRLVMIRLEQVRGEVLERLERLDRRLALHEQRLGRIDQRLAEIAERLDALRQEPQGQPGLRLLELSGVPKTLDEATLDEATIGDELFDVPVADR